MLHFFIYLNILNLVLKQVFFIFYNVPSTLVNLYLNLLKKYINIFLHVKTEVK